MKKKYQQPNIDVLEMLMASSCMQAVSMGGDYDPKDPISAPRRNFHPGLED